MSSSVLGILDWKMSGDDNGQRTYTLKTLVETTDKWDDPVVVYLTPGLPKPGSSWNPGNGYDSFAFCSPGFGIEPIVTNEPNYYYVVTQKFTTNPSKRRKDDRPNNPLAEPAKFSGGTITDKKPLLKDKNGKAILSTSHEPIYGLEQDDSRPSVRVSINSAVLVSWAYSLLHTVNDSPLWGIPAGWVKLTTYTWEENWLGTGYKYFTNHYDFEIKKGGWKLEDILNAGYKVLDGNWQYNTGNNEWDWITRAGADPTKPNDFILNKDPYGNVVSSPVPLTQGGLRLTDPNAPYFLPAIDYLDSSNFLLLGVPASF